jgi:type IV pilus assembly protein PilW
MRKKFFQYPKYSGFTLIEVLISLAISGFFVSVVYTSFKSQQDSYLAQDKVVEMQQNIRYGLGTMIQELRMAGYDPYGARGAGLEEVNNDNIVFTCVADDDGVDNDNNGVVDEKGELKTIKFDLYDAYGDGSLDIGRQVGNNATTKRVIAENIEEIELSYVDSDGDTTTDPREVRGVQISILVRDEHEDKNFYDSEAYTSASGTRWGPYNDHFRRRFQTVTVNLRNMEK